MIALKLAVVTLCVAIIMIETEAFHHDSDQNQQDHTSASQGMGIQDPQSYSHEGLQDSGNNQWSSSKGIEQTQDGMKTEDEGHTKTQTDEYRHHQPRGDVKHKRHIHLDIGYGLGLGHHHHHGFGLLGHGHHHHHHGHHDHYALLQDYFDHHHHHHHDHHGHHHH